MSARGPRVSIWTRRALIGSLLPLPCAFSQKGRLWPGERRRYADPATEFVVERLTDPACASLLPSPHARAVARRGGLLLYCSDRDGSFQAYLMEERTGESRQLTEARSLDPATLTLLPDGDAVCYFDGGVLYRLSVRNLKVRQIYRSPEGRQRRGALSLSPDGDEIALVEQGADGYALRLIRTSDGRANTVLVRSSPIYEPILDRRRRQIAYIHEESLWLVGRRGEPNWRLAVPPGRVRQAFWAGDGKSLLYLHQPYEKGKLSAIRQYEPDSHTDRLVAETSQFACFTFNSDGSVFLGASANVASPHLLLLLRATRRELTLCEHAARDPMAVNPRFSPDSRRVYFQSDRDGKPALYSMRVEGLIEPTDSQP